MVRLRPHVFALHPDADQASRELSELIFNALGRENKFYLKTELEDAASHISDDLCILQRENAGWRLKGASLCAPTFWALNDKMGQLLHELHGPVPDGASIVAPRVTRIFDNLQPGKILERFNWTVQLGAERYTPDQTPMKQRAAKTPLESALDVLYLRVERQTIRKLAVSGAIVFTIRICIDPLRGAIAPRENLIRFKESWSGVSPELANYKGWPAYDALVQFACAQLEDSV